MVAVEVRGPSAETTEERERKGTKENSGAESVLILPFDKELTDT